MKNKVLLAEPNHGDAAAAKFIIRQAGVAPENIIHCSEPDQILPMWQGARDEIGLVITATFDHTPGNWQTDKLDKIIEEMRANDPELPIITLTGYSEDSFVAQHPAMARETVYTGKGLEFGRLGPLIRQKCPQFTPAG